MDFSLQMQRFNESLMATLLYLLNNPESRLYVRSDVGLEVLKVYQLCMIIQFIYLIFFLDCLIFFYHFSRPYFSFAVCASSIH